MTPGWEGPLHLETGKDFFSAKIEEDCYTVHMFGCGPSTGRPGLCRLSALDLIKIVVKVYIQVFAKGRWQLALGDAHGVDAGIDR